MPWVLLGDWFLGREGGPWSRQIGVPATNEYLETGCKMISARVMSQSYEHAGGQGVPFAATEEGFTGCSGVLDFEK